MGNIGDEIKQIYLDFVHDTNDNSLKILDPDDNTPLWGIDHSIGLRELENNPEWMSWLEAKFGQQDLESRVVLKTGQQGLEYIPVDKTVSDELREIANSLVVAVVGCRLRERRLTREITEAIRTDDDRTSVINWVVSMLGYNEAMNLFDAAERRFGLDAAEKVLRLVKILNDLAPFANPKRVFAEILGADDDRKALDDEIKMAAFNEAMSVVSETMTKRLRGAICDGLGECKAKLNFDDTDHEKRVSLRECGISQNDELLLIRMMDKACDLFDRIKPPFGGKTFVTKSNDGFYLLNGSASALALFMDRILRVLRDESKYDIWKTTRVLFPGLSKTNLNTMRSHLSKAGKTDRLSSMDNYALDVANKVFETFHVTKM